MNIISRIFNGTRREDAPASVTPVTSIPRLPVQPAEVASMTKEGDAVRKAFSVGAGDENQRPLSRRERLELAVKKRRELIDKNVVTWSKGQPIPPGYTVVDGFLMRDNRPVEVFRWDAFVRQNVILPTGEARIMPPPERKLLSDQSAKYSANFERLKEFGHQSLSREIHRLHNAAKDKLRAGETPEHHIYSQEAIENSFQRNAMHVKDILREIFLECHPTLVAIAARIGEASKEIAADLEAEERSLHEADESRWGWPFVAGRTLQALKAVPKQVQMAIPPAATSGHNPKAILASIGIEL